MPSEFDDDFLPQEEIDALGLERSVHGNETLAQLSERLLMEAAPNAAQVIINLANNPAANDRTRLTAAQYIIDRTCGRIGDATRSEDGRAPWDHVFDAVLVDAPQSDSA